MVFLVIILLVVGVVLGLNYIDNTNIQKIEDFLNHQNCKEINYTKGKYQAICSDKVVIIENAFSVDLSKTQTVYFKTLKTIQNNKNELILISHEDVKLEFKDDSTKEKFLKKLEEKRIK